ncbi:MAG: MMPL family transporter [Pseudomonadota bacterium]
MNFLATALERWVALVERHPGRFLLVILVLSGLCGFQVLTGFAINSDLGRLIRPSDDLRWYQADEAFKARFPAFQQTSLVVVSGADAGDVDRTALELAEVFRASDAFEFVFAPALDPFLRNHRAYFLDAELLADWITGVQYDYGALLRLADGADLANAAFTFADQVSATDGLRLPTVLRTLADQFQSDVPETLRVEAYPHLVPDDDVHYLVIILKGLQNLSVELPNAEQVATIRQLMDTVTPPEGVRLRLTGEVPLAHEEISTALDGIAIAGMISLVLLALILHFGVGSWRIIAATFALLGVGVLWTLAFAVTVVGAFNTLSLMFVVMFFGLGVDFAVHYSLRAREAAGAGAPSLAQKTAARDIGSALGLCMVTSSLAFLAFLPTDYLALGELGIISAGGMAIAFLLTVTLLPAIYAYFGLPAEDGPSATRAPRGTALLALLEHPARVLLLVAMLGLLGAWLARDLRFDYSVLALRDADSEAMAALLELQDAGVTTDYSINVMVNPDEDAQGLEQALDALDASGPVLSPESIVPAEQQAKAAALAELERLLDTVGPVLPADAEFAEEGLREALLYLEEVRGKVSREDEARLDAFSRGLKAVIAEPERLANLNRALEASLAEELDDLRRIVAAQPFGFEALPADLRARLVAPDGTRLLTVAPARAIDDRAATDAFVEAVMEVTPAVAGRAIVEWGVGSVAARSFVEAVVLAVSVISVLLVIYFRGLVLPLIVLTPLVLSTIMTFAVIEVTSLTLNMANILVVPLIFGLGVDTGIHVVHRFTALQHAGPEGVATLLRSSTARAVLISGLTTIGTFFSLSFSPHAGAASVGILLTVAIGFMLVTTFLVVPALLTLRASRIARG